MREALLKAAYASDDDAERLVLADWLEQHGEVARAQVIHLQCELARLGPYDRRRHELAWELDAVLAELGDAWTKDLPEIDGVTWLTLARGLASAVRVRDATTLFGIAKAIHAAAPTVDTVVLDRIEVGGGDKIPWLRTLRLEDTAANPVLGLTTHVEIDGENYLLGDQYGAQLESITISGNSSLGDEFAAEVASSVFADTLRVLRMPTTRAEGSTGYYDQDPRMTAEGAGALTALTALETLQIDLHLPTARLAERLFALPKLRDFSARQIGVKKLAVPRKGAAFESVVLSQNAIGNAVTAAIAQSPRMAKLQRLVLDTCEVEATALGELAASPLWNTLRVLDLSRNPLGKAGARYLGEAAVPRLLHTLRLADVDFDDSCAALLGKTRWLGKLLELDLTGNRFGRGLTGLRDLDVDGLRKLSLMSVGMERSEAVVLSKFWPKLVHLAIGDNAIGDAGIERFATTKEATHLQSLSLYKCNLTDDGLELLARARCPRLRSLELWGNKITGAGIAQLLAAPIMRDVAALDLRHCELDHASIEKLAQVPLPQALAAIDLRANELTPEALLVLAESRSLRTAKLRLDGNPFTYDPRVRERLAERFGPSWYQADDV